MKTRLSVLILIAVLVLTVPVSAKEHEPIGGRINLLLGAPTVYDAGEPFHILHGWWLDPEWEHPIGLWSFELKVDGNPMEEDFVTRWADPASPLILYRLWVYNFPDGMPEGTVTFTGHWYGPCQAGVDTGLISGPCANRNEIMEFLTDSLTVTFN
jgi:hypothetical protein